jgi:predicted ribosomally synthesized peptide with nif11-like leader
MALQSAKELVERLRTDQGLRDRIAALTSIEERLELVNFLGYGCTGEEIKEAWDNYG